MGKCKASNEIYESKCIYKCLGRENPSSPIPKIGKNEIFPWISERESKKKRKKEKKGYQFGEFLNSFKNGIFRKMLGCTSKKKAQKFPKF